VSGRRSEHSALPSVPVFRVERRDGVLYLGDNPCRECQICATMRDPARFTCCPVCAQHFRREAAERWAAIALDAYLEKVALGHEGPES